MNTHRPGINQLHSDRSRQSPAHAEFISATPWQEYGFAAAIGENASDQGE
jgi:ElaB/YqjD/DUF883 family membrane-anchored ribosome-binding protein